MQDRHRAIRIALDPHLPLGQFFGRNHTPATTSLDALGPGAGGELRLGYSGTTALYQAIRALHIGTGARALLPAYNCGHEVEAARRSGAQLDYYRVGRDLQPDLGHIAELLANPCDVLVVTHFFGFPPSVREISELCHQHGVKLIEDCAHCLLEPGNPGVVGRHADAVVYSLRKTLPIATGGAVWLKAGTGFDWQAIAPPGLSVVRRKLYLLGKTLRAAPGRWRNLPGFWAARGARAASSGLCALAQSLERIQHDPEDESLEFPDVILGWDMDSWSRDQLRSFNYPDIAARRRKNFSLLHEVFQERWPHSLLLPLAQAPVCPLAYAFVAKDRARLLAHLHDCGVPALDWWSQFHAAVPWKHFHVERGLKDQVVALPIHQDLDAAALDATLAALGEAEESI